ncbi:hypothetical protein SSEA_SKINNY_9 [Mycobacterium phage Skinny]|uniref:Uncharacterized protein n=5 Tax=Bongovirus bongo TaxID=1983750 RepID=A0A514DJ05_9CAUD|nr:hypothetical protein PEGLEG_8 [Mycobacterium phage PegLeg]YP_009604866.1 hypothetical protein FDH95_gp008 [Mycobacterium phage Bongo]AXQ52649.1 hypothetical protein SEA_IPHANE7_8 [Mycobacterium phage IPhane7]QDH93582.1 hypothetical protein SEA_LILHOMIEP_8 [Mycobacterium phage LilhomieP]QGJ93155.1 hypothetical protein SEA_TYDAWG_8 [Mycobacterium phage TyDawg]UXE05217.1 hypothetical protein SSEA_SKINNY_9 [Mycobacterium phage Skinny]WNM75222.1 hypothetical protein SEA_AUSPICE_8 [Mycobacterium
MSKPTSKTGSWFVKSPYDRMPEVPENYSFEVTRVHDTGSEYDVMVVMRRGSYPLDSRYFSARDMADEWAFASAVRCLAHDMWNKQAHDDDIKTWIKEKVWET